MAMTINTNVVSINSQRNLGLSGGSLATSMQRLSSGLRVNSAKDDAAGLAIAERMNAQSRGLAVASRNANDGISMAQTAEGALGKVGDMLQRMRELAVQSSNATNSADDRKALQAEVSQLRSEIDRVAKTTAFNGTKILDGSFAGAVFQVGSSAGDNITAGSLANATAAGLNGKDLSYGKFTAAVTKADDTATSGVDESKLSEVLTGFATKIVDGDIKINDTSVGEIAAANSAEERLGQVVAAVNAKTADTGVTAFLAKDDATGYLSVEFRGDKDVKIELAGAGVLANSGLTGADASDASKGKAAAVTGGLTDISVQTQQGAWEAIKRIDGAIDQVNSARADLGALQTRFEKSIENIDIMNENIKAARGRIVDADFATETANLSRAQILQQAGTAMVAQANQLPQQVLSLLK